MNVLNDNWLFVKYNTGKVKQISVRQAFQDAEKIKNIETPTFNNSKVYIYDVPVIQFLSILLLAAYFNSKTKYASGTKTFNDKLVKDGWDNKVLTDYFDKWQDRFNLFDDKYPFLQDIRMKDEIEKVDKKADPLAYISKSSVIAPSANNSIFEHNSETKLDIANFKPTEDELVYILLYLRSLGTSPMAKYYPNKAISSNASMFIQNYGKNLKETIIANCLPLRESSTGDLRDKPIWEFNDISEIKDYPLEDIYKNVLLCTYFPCYPIYIQYDNEVKNIFLAKIATNDSRETSYDLFDGETRTELSSKYVYYNPWAIKRHFIDEKAERDDWIYKDWNNTIKLINLCIEITQKMPDGFNCNLIGSGYLNLDNVNNVIYYREYDGKKCNVLSFGKYNIPKGILTKLQNEKNHDKALQFQANLNEIQNKFLILKDAGLLPSTLNDIKVIFAKYAEHYFFETFVSNITKKDCVDVALDEFIKYAKNSVKKLETVTNNPLKYAEAYRKFSGSLNKLKKGTEDNG